MGDIRTSDTRRTGPEDSPYPRGTNVPDPSCGSLGNCPKFFHTPLGAGTTERTDDSQEQIRRRDMMDIDVRRVA